MAAVSTASQTERIDGEDPGPETGRALGALATALLTLLALLAISYYVPGLERFRPWVPSDDGAPLARLFANYGEIPAFAGAGGAYAAPQSAERIEEQLGSAVAANLGDQSAATPTPTPRPAPSPGDATPAVQIDPSEYEGIEQEIENARALAPFFESLKDTALRERQAVTRVAHYGDSSIATDLITHTIRRRLQQRFGDAGHGFHLIARGTMPYGHRDVMHRSGDGWDLDQVTNQSDRDGLYGYGGVAYEPTGTGAYAKFGTDDRGPVGTRVSEFQIYYRTHPRGGRIIYRVDGGERQELSLVGTGGDAVEVVEVPDGAHELELRAGGGGPVRLYGVALERNRPGVVYDSLGLVGARARRLLHFDQEHIRRQMELRDPDLLVLGFGGNEADDPLRRIEESYEDQFVRVIRRMRAGRREMACLVFAPLDQARRNERGQVETIPAVPAIVEAQRAAARREGCAFFNTFEAMGGEGAMREWSRARPRLATTDYRHATPAGYEVLGNMFYKALLKAFADHL